MPASGLSRSALEEGERELVERRGLLEARQVARPGDVGASRARERRREVVGDRLEVGLVAFAGQDERGHVQRAEDHGQVAGQQRVVRVVVRLEAKGVELLLSDRRPHRLGCRPRPELDVDLRRSFEIAGLEGGLLGCEEAAHLLRPGVAGKRRTGEHETRNALRVRCGEVERYETEKNEIKAVAEKLEAEAHEFDRQSEVQMHQHHRWAQATTALQVAIALAAIALLSSGNWFEPRHRFAVFFPGSVRGLNKGAPVTFRGVRVGEVKDVTAFLTGKDETPIQIEVVIEVRTNVVESPEGQSRPLAGVSTDQLAKALIDQDDMERAMHNVEILEKCALAYLLAICSERKITKIPAVVREIAFAKLRGDQKKIERGEHVTSGE